MGIIFQGTNMMSRISAMMMATMMTSCMVSLLSLEDIFLTVYTELKFWIFSNVR
jgi:hypothetical protein